MTDVLQATKRDSTGTAATTRLRRSGHVPAVLYGHGKENEHLAIPATQISTLLRHNTRMIKLSGDVSDNALVTEMQWDALGIEVLHLDLIRVNLKEEVEVIVSIELHGEAPGVREGGILLENVREVEVRCSAGSIPETIILDINELRLGQQAVASDLELPEGVELLIDGDTVIAHVEQPREEIEGEEETEGVQVGAEPEVISRGGEGDNEGEKEA